MAEGKADAILAVLAAREGATSGSFAKRVRACTDGATLDAWLRRAATATRASDVFDEPRATREPARAPARKATSRTRRAPTA